MAGRSPSNGLSRTPTRHYGLTGLLARLSGVAWAALARVEGEQERPVSEFPYFPSFSFASTYGWASPNPESPSLPQGTAHRDRTDRCPNVYLHRRREVSTTMAVILAGVLCTCLCCSASLTRKRFCFSELPQFTIYRFKIGTRENTRWQTGTSSGSS